MQTIQSLLLIGLSLLCLCHQTAARSIECSTLCTEGYQIPSCECFRYKVKLPFRFGKRGSRVPFRYGKRNSAISTYDNPLDRPSYDDALDLLRSYAYDEY